MRAELSQVGQSQVGQPLNMVHQGPLEFTGPQKNWESISPKSQAYRLIPVLGPPPPPLACSAFSGQTFPQRVNSPLYLQLHFKDTKLKQVIYSPHTRKSN